MSTGVPPVAFNALKDLAAMVSNGTFSYQALVAAAETAGLTVGEFVWGVYAQMGGSGATAGWAGQIWTAIKGLAEASEIQTAFNAARTAGYTASATGAAPLADAASKAGFGGRLAGGLGRIGALFGASGTAATAVGAVVTFIAVSAVIWGVGRAVSALTTEDIDPNKPNWSKYAECNQDQAHGGATFLGILYDPVPYSGRTTVCRDRSGRLWANPNGQGWRKVVSGPKRGEPGRKDGCFTKSSITTEHRTMGGQWCDASSF